MIDAQATVHAAKHAGINILLYAAACVIIAVLYVAIDTHGFTKQPSWWQARQAVGYDSPTN